MLSFDAPVQDSIGDERRLLEDLYRDRHLTAYAMGEGIPLLADEIMIVCRGIVQLGTVHLNGDEALLGLVGSGMPLGLPLTMLDIYSVKAMTAVDVLRVTLAELAQSPHLLSSLWLPLTRRLRQTEALLALTGKRRVADRLQQFLSLLAQELGQPVASGTRITVRLTHHHLASAIGTTRVTVTRLLNQWRQEGKISFDEHRHIIIPDRTFVLP